MTVPLGISLSELKKMTLKEYNAIVKGFHLKRKIADEDAWIQGQYNLIAFKEVISSFGAGMSGKKYKIDYPKRPQLQMAEHEQEDLEKEIEHDVAIMQMWTEQLSKNGGLKDSPY